MSDFKSPPSSQSSNEEYARLEGIRADDTRVEAYEERRDAEDFDYQPSSSQDSTTSSYFSSSQESGYLSDDENTAVDDHEEEGGPPTPTDGQFSLTGSQAGEHSMEPAEPLFLLSSSQPSQNDCEESSGDALVWPGSSQERN